MVPVEPNIEVAGSIQHHVIPNNPSKRLTIKTGLLHHRFAGNRNGITPTLDSLSAH
jgi:hypothetical protein